MSIDLDSFPLPYYEKDREEPPFFFEGGTKPRTKTEAFRFAPHSLLNKARPRALGRSAGSFPVVLFLPRERRTEEVCPARRVSVKSFSCLGRELYDLFPYYIESIKKEVFFSAPIACFV